MNIRIGTRGSALALAQTNLIIKELKNLYPDITIETTIIKTTGDTILDTKLAAIGGKGLFVKEIEEALLENTIDIAVHSMKDLPGIMPDGLMIGAIQKRERYEDVLITHNKCLFSELPLHGTLGTSSLRRQAQILAKRPDLTIKNLRGNVDTRIRKLHRKEYDGIVIAYAGLARLRLTHEITEILEWMLPAPCQGAVGIECRQDDIKIISLIQQLDHHTTRIAIEAERAFLTRIGGGCEIPMAALATITNETELHIRGLVASCSGNELITHEIAGNIDDRIQLGRTLADQILNNGGSRILKMLHR